MRIRHTIFYFLIGGMLLFSNILYGKPVAENADSLYPSEDRQLEKLGIITDGYAVTLSTISLPLPVYHFLAAIFHFDSYKPFFFCKEFFFISPFLRNAFYVYISIHAP